jgi:pimeloyl-ACP methyl ester carboxylesterase
VNANAKTILYLHGFASSPSGRKVTRLTELLSPEGFRLVAPDLNRPSFERLDFEAMVETALAEAKASPPAVLVGSSLGSLVALEAAGRGVAAPLVLIAPAIGFGGRWTDKLPGDELLRFFHHGAGEEKPIHRRFFEQMAQTAAGRKAPASPVTVIMGRKDESVPFELVEAAWCRWVASKKLPAGSHFVEIPEGDHGLLEFVPQIAEEIRISATVLSSSGA